MLTIKAESVNHKKVDLGSWQNYVQNPNPMLTEPNGHDVLEVYQMYFVQCLVAITSAIIRSIFMLLTVFTMVGKFH